LASATERVVAAGFGSPFIDGRFSDGEWATAGSVDTMVWLPDRTLAPATVFVANDARNLYFGLRVHWAPLQQQSGSGVTFFVNFDSNLDGAFDTGDDAIAFLTGNVMQPFLDSFRFCSSLGLPSDANCGGTSDGGGAAVVENGVTTIEMWHPLNSGDPFDGEFERDILRVAASITLMEAGVPGHTAVVRTVLLK
jgi:hypothetical protein